MSLGNILWSIFAVGVLILGSFLGHLAGTGNPKAEPLPEGINIEFLYIGEGDTFIAKIGHSTEYHKYKFSGEQPKVGKYRVVGIGMDKRELIPIPPETTETPK